MRCATSVTPRIEEDAHGEQDDADDVAGDDAPYRCDKLSRPLECCKCVSPARDQPRHREQGCEAPRRKDAERRTDPCNGQAGCCKREIKPDAAPSSQSHNEIALADEAILMEIGDRIDGEVTKDEMRYMLDTLSV